MAYDVITPTPLASAELTAVMSTYRTVPASSRDIITTITVANNTAAAETFSIHLVPSGGSADNSNALFGGVSIAANSQLSWNGAHVLNESGTIQAVASATGLTLIASGGNAV